MMDAAADAATLPKCSKEMQWDAEELCYAVTEGGSNVSVSFDVPMHPF